jgi:hypothetical protein
MLARFSSSEGRARLRPQAGRRSATPPRGFSSVPAVEHAARLRGMYAAFNARDIDVLLEQVTPDLDWPNAWEGGRVHGHEEVCDRWSRERSVINPSVERSPSASARMGRVAVEVDQVVRGPDGAVLAEDASSTSTPCATD